MYVCPADRDVTPAADNGDRPVSENPRPAADRSPRPRPQPQPDRPQAQPDPPQANETPSQDAAAGSQVSREPATLGDGEIANTDRLAERFRALYTAMMDKQVGFKETVEPFKTDNQNAGKG